MSPSRPNQVWHVDLTVVPTAAGLWCPWAPQAVPQCWPFCWWVAVVVDNCSRRVVGAATFLRQPSAVQTRAFLGKAMGHARARPKYLVCDRGVQFDCEGFRNWCRTNRIRPRYGALGKHGSIAVVERCIRTLKELLRQLPIVPLDRHSMRREMTLVCDWYNEHRPHDALGGKTPNEVYHNRFPAHRKPRYEPRSHWPRGSPCAQPWALVRGRPGSVLLLDLRFLEGRKHLPIVTVRPAA